MLNPERMWFVLLNAKEENSRLIVSKKIEKRDINY